jgi:hypothetical protein
MRRSILSRWMVLLATFSMFALVQVAWPPAALAHAPLGCSFTKKASQPFGSPERVYPISHGCAWLRIGPLPARLPVVHVRKHLASGRVVTRTYVAPATNLDAARGIVGTCGLDSWSRFIVAYPFVTIILQPAEDLAGRRDCRTDIGDELMWTLQLSGNESRSPVWFTHGVG